MNPMVHTILKWEKELEAERQNHTLRRGIASALESISHSEQTSRKPAVGCTCPHSPCQAPQTACH